MKKITVVSLLVAIGIALSLHSASAIGACKTTAIPVKIITRNASGALLPGMNFVIYQEKTNPDGNPYFGDSLASGKTDAGGQGDVVCISGAKTPPYAVKVYESNASYGYTAIWNSEIEYNVDSFLRTANVRLGSLTVVLRDSDGTVIKDAPFDVYLQSFDINNEPIIDETKLNADKLVFSNFNTGAYGARTNYLGAGRYVVRIHATGGKDYIYVWNQEVAATANTTLDYRISTLNVILEDGYGALVKNQKLSIFKQGYDVRGKAILGTLVAQDLNTGNSGAAVAYLRPGTYAIKIGGTYSGSFYYRWKVDVANQESTTITYRMSGFRIIIRDAAGGLTKNAIFSIGTQRLDAVGKPILDTMILKNISTGERGYADVYLTPDSYVLQYGDKRLYQLDANENQFTKIDWPRVVSVRPKAEVELSNPFGNVNLTMRKRTNPIVRLPNFKTMVSGSAYRVEATSISKPYTVTFYYEQATLTKKGTKADKVKIAYYNEVTKKWSYVGTNYPSRRLAQVKLKDKGTLVLVAVK